MANHYRILIDVWSKVPSTLHEFVGALMAEGWYAHLPVPDGSEKSAWGGYLLPDMRILTAAGFIDVNEPGSNLPRFSAVTIDERKELFRSTDHPGLIVPAPDDYMVSIIAESRSGIPFKYFVHVIDKYYDDGLRLFVLAFDHADASYGSADAKLFYSVDSDYQFDLDKVNGRSEHSVGLTVPDLIHCS